MTPQQLCGGLGFDAHLASNIQEQQLNEMGKSRAVNSLVLYYVCMPTEKKRKRKRNSAFCTAFCPNFRAKAYPNIISFDPNNSLEI